MNQLKHKCFLGIRLMLTVLIISAFQQLKAQNIVTGEVTDSSGKPLQGVSVQVKNSTKGTTTNDQGTYSINALSTDVLVFSYVGFNPQEVSVGNRLTIDINL